MISKMWLNLYVVVGCPKRILTVHIMLLSLFTNTTAAVLSLILIFDSCQPPPPLSLSFKKKTKGGVFIKQWALSCQNPNFGLF